MLKSHFFSRRAEVLIGVVFFLIGSYFLYMGFNARGKNVPWPGGAVLPF